MRTWSTFAMNWSPGGAGPDLHATIEDLMDKLKQQLTIVTVTHNMQQAARVADYTAFFHLDELIEYNDTRMMFSNPHTKKAEDYITGRYG